MLGAFKSFPCLTWRYLPCPHQAGTAWRFCQCEHLCWLNSHNYANFQAPLVALLGLVLNYMNSDTRQCNSLPLYFSKDISTAKVIP